MDDDIFPELCLMNTKKTYSKTAKNQSKEPPMSNNAKKATRPSEKAVDPGEPLTTKVAVEYLLSGKLKSEVCRYCLKISPGLSELDQIMQIAGTGVMYKITIREMIACFYPFKVSENQEFPESICQRCVDKALNAYLFTQQCEQAERALHNCFLDMDEKLTKLDPIDRPKKRGRQKLKPNYNVLYAEHRKVMDYAEPIRNLINLQSEPLTKEPDWNEFECKKCWQVLPDLESLLNHEKIHPKTMWYNCRLCGKSFVKHNQLKKHHNQIHVRGKQTAEVDKTFKCKECGNVTENYEQHLQHIEKHKFKSVMEHLIERKTDQLCLICLKKGTNLVDLDKMVCIHGSCPELVGDKTLYAVLASTLPDKKSYKYQELYIPQKAKIMTITKRKRKYQDNEKHSDIMENKEIKFNLSYPITVTSETFKTDDVYYYVFCDPETDKFIIRTTEHKTNHFDAEISKCIEITDEIPTECAKGDKTVIGKETSLHDHSKSEHKTSDGEITNDDNKLMDSLKTSMKDGPTEMNLAHDAKADQIISMDFNENYYQANKTTTVSKQDTHKILKKRDELDLLNDCGLEDDCPEGKESIALFTSAIPDFIEMKNIKENLNEAFKFCEPIIIHMSHPAAAEFNVENKGENKQDVVTVYNFSKPDYVNSSGNYMQDPKPILGTNLSKNNVEPTNKNSGLDWIFDKTPKTTNNDEEVMTKTVLSSKIDEDCKFCWIFKNNKCEYCKKTLTVNDYNQNSENNVIEQPTTSTKTAVKHLEIIEKPIGIEEDIKQDPQKTWQCNVCLTNNNRDRFTCCCCESKKYIKNGNCKIAFGNNNTFFDMTHKKLDVDDIFNNEVTAPKVAEPFIIIKETSTMDVECENLEPTDKETNIIQSMEVETDTINDSLNTKVPFNEEMDIEECVPITNFIQKFEPAPIQTLATNIGPFIGTDIQFNIGSQPVQNVKGGRKIKRAVRKIPIAFHK